jgi:hypothetical protein
MHGHTNLKFLALLGLKASVGGVGMVVNLFADWALELQLQMVQLRHRPVLMAAQSVCVCVCVCEVSVR